MEENKQKEKKVYCYKHDCVFIGQCRYHPIWIPPYPLSLVKVESPEYFGDKCQLRIRNWVEEMLG